MKRSVYLKDVYYIVCCKHKPYKRVKGLINAYVLLINYLYAK